MFYSNPSKTAQYIPKKLKLILVNAVTNNKSYELEVSYWMTIAELKSKIEKRFAVPVAQQRLFFQDQELNQNNVTLSSFAMKKQIKIILRPTPRLENTMGLVKKYETLPSSEKLESILYSVQEGFNIGLIPQLSFDGTSGTYFLRNKFRKTIAVFKPFDEEPFAPNNPREYKGKLGMHGFKPGILSGEAAIREVSTYLLDTKGFSSVPTTTFVEIVHPYFSNRDMKEFEIPDNTESPMLPIQNYTQFTGQDKKLIIKHGSLQKFVDGAEGAGDYAYNKFPDSEVRKIALLDLRILNCDRNEGNILVKKDKGELKLIPIDHGLSFPDCFEACTWDAVWMDWPQVKKKWSSVELDYISRIDPKGDCEKLAKLFKFRDICLRNFRIAETVLKTCALAGLTIFEIGNIMYKEDPDLKSPIEELVKKTEEFYYTMINSMPKEVLKKMTKRETNKIAKKLRLDEHEETKDNSKYRDNRFLENGRTSQDNGFKAQPHHSMKVDMKDKNDGQLFVIPEMDLIPTVEPLRSKKQSSNVDAYKNKEAIDFVENVKDKESDDGSGSDGEDDGKANAALLGRRHMKRSNSVPSKVQRIPSVEKKKEDEDDDWSPEEKSEKKNKKKNLIQKNLKNKKVIKSNDEIFFKYFEGFLKQKIDIIMRGNEPRPTRTRFMSDT